MMENEGTNRMYACDKGNWPAIATCWRIVAPASMAIQNANQI